MAGLVAMSVVRRPPQRGAQVDRKGGRLVACPLSGARRHRPRVPSTRSVPQPTRSRRYEMKMHMLSGGRVRMRKSTYLPGAHRSEMIELPVSCILLRHAHGNVLFDTGCHPSIAEDPEPRLGWMSKFMIPIMAPDDNVITGLNCIGLEPDDVDVVVCSHLHPDHCGCNAFFRTATVMVHARELETAKAPGAQAVAAGCLLADRD